MEIEPSPQKTQHQWSTITLVRIPRNPTTYHFPFSKLISEQLSLWLSRIQLPTWGEPLDKWETKCHFLVRKAWQSEVPSPCTCPWPQTSEGLVIFWLCDDPRNSLLLPQLPPMEKVDKMTTVTLFSSLGYSVVQLLSCVQLCDAMDGSVPVFPALHNFLEFPQTHIHWVSDARLWWVLSKNIQRA